MPAARPPPEAGIVDDVGHERKRRQVLGDFKTDRALPCDHVEIVERRHYDGAALARELARDRIAVFGRAIVEHDLGTVGLRALLL